MPMTESEISPFVKVAELIAAQLSQGDIATHDGERVLFMRIPANVSRQFLSATKLLVSETAGDDNSASLEIAVLKDQIEIQLHQIAILKREFKELQSRKKELLEKFAELKTQKITGEKV